MTNHSTSLEARLREIRACTICADHLVDGVRPVLQAHESARILIAGQAPGRRVHESGVPFEDPSGDRLRDWMGIDAATFYDPTKIAIVPMGFCFPGTGRSGDLAPRRECAEAWRTDLLARLPAIGLTLVIGAYAMRWHLGPAATKVTDTVRAWKQYLPAQIPLPHPSPRNNIWMRKNPWFGDEVLPVLRTRVSDVLA
jgi:uracil-DNA glycosylase